MIKTITFIGAGNMTSSLVAGLIQDNTTHTIRISDPNESQTESIKSLHERVSVYNQNNDAIKNSDVVVLAVKPQIMRIVCEEIASQISAKKPLVISIAAGITIVKLKQWLTSETIPIVRCMPNTPALVQAGMTGLYANKYVNAEQYDLSENIMQAVGETLWLENESKIDAVTAVSGSGPAYYFLVMEAMQKTAEEMGLSVDQARQLVLQTALGAAKLAKESTDDAAILRQRVTSKGGTTEAAINKLLEDGLPESFKQALLAAESRSKELSKL